MHFTLTRENMNLCQVPPPPAPAKIVHGGWSEWHTWTVCQTLCGKGTEHRRRACDNPAPSGVGGRSCRGEPTFSRECKRNIDCPLEHYLPEPNVRGVVDGGWSAWMVVDNRCEELTCGSDIKDVIKKERVCLNPRPQNGGKECEGDEREEEQCSAKPCKGKHT